MAAGPSPLPQSSQRKRSRTRRFLYALAAPLLFNFTRVLWWTCRLDTVLGQEYAQQFAKRDEPIVLCYWHDEILVTGLYLDRVAERKTRLNYLVSPSVDGDLVQQILELGGAHVIRGSATRSGIKSLRHMLRAIKRESTSPVILPDGPIGPPHECKAGAVMLAQMSGKEILPVAGAASRVLRLGTWDRLQVPVPFSKIAIAFGAPFHAEPDLDTAGVERCSHELGVVLRDLRVQAEQQLKAPA